MSARLDYAVGGEAGYTGEDVWGVSLAGDAYDSAHMSQFVPPVAQQQGLSWWESLAAYGITKAIDNRFGPTNIAGNTDAGNFAGANGATYSNRPNGAGGGVSRPGAQAPAQAGMGSGTMLLIGAAVLGLLALRG